MKQIKFQKEREENKMDELPEGCEIIDGMIICRNKRFNNSEEETYTDAKDSGTRVSVERSNNAKDLNVC